MQDESDLEGSIVVEIITYTIYFGWLSVLSWIALWLDIPPLPSIEQSLQPQWRGTLAAIAVGVAFIAVSHRLYGYGRSRLAAASASPAELEPTPPPEPEPAPASSNKRKRRKKKRR